MLEGMSSTIESYFDHKKDLSNKSKTGEQRKKAINSSSDLLLSKETNDDTDVFTKLFQSDICSQKVMKFTNLTKYVISSTKDAQFKGARQLEEVSESIMKFINEKLDEFKVDQKQN